MNKFLKKLSGTFQKLVYNGKDKSVEPELDPIRSIDGDYKAIATGSTGQLEVYDLPSNKKFYMHTLIINNDEGSLTTYLFHDSTGTTTPLFKVSVEANASMIHTGIEIQAITTSVYVTASQATSGSTVTVGGKLADT